RLNEEKQADSLQFLTKKSIRGVLVTHT
ncbi:MAG: hypothetical protein RLY50_1026, partial [Actinomycetota bacterium]